MRYFPQAKSLPDPYRHVFFSWRYREKCPPASDCLGESFDWIALQIVSNRTILGVVDRHPDRSPECDGQLRHLRQSLMDIGLLGQRGIEVDAKIFSTPMSAATKMGLGTDLSVAMIACGRNARLDPTSPRTRLEGDLGKVLLLQLGARSDALRTGFVADLSRIPLKETTLPGMAGWRGSQPLLLMLLCS